ncbi:MAG: hypothetical protein H6719_07830 [Sandaracinaceae bacterium]|nr:hypothetical protein [Sandaracinaceae bacterium]
MRYLLLAAAVWACGCSGEASLVVDLRSDLRPAVNFAYVRTEYRVDPSGPALEVRETPVVSSTDVVRGLRVGAFEGVTPGAVYVDVTLHDSDGLPVAGRRVNVAVRGPTAVTVLVVSACVDVTCEGDQVCVGGACGDARCTPETPEYCDATCDATSCRSPVACGTAECMDQVCFVRTDDGACGASQICDPRVGCRGAPAPPDAGTPSLTDAGSVPDAGGPPDAGLPRDAGSARDASGCRSSEVECGDGLDGDCDGAIDCADSDCASVTCDDGIFCNGPDRCSAGACRPSGTDPCAGETCHEAERACGECLSDTDCPADSSTGWTCTYALCEEVTDATRDTTTWTCTGSVCEERTFEERDPGACVRSTEGNSCGTTVIGGWSACMYDHPRCAESGDQTRTVTLRQCVAGFCESVPTVETNFGAAACDRSTTGMICMCPVGCSPCTCDAGDCDYVCTPPES